MSRRIWSPDDDAGRALLWRHRTAMHILLEHGRVEPDEALGLLTIVVDPTPEQSSESLKAVRDNTQAAA